MYTLPLLEVVYLSTCRCLMTIGDHCNSYFMDNLSSSSFFILARDRNMRESASMLIYVWLMVDKCGHYISL